MNTLAYQCPGCGAPLTYDAKSGKLKCTACSSLYEFDAMEDNVLKQNVHVGDAEIESTYTDGEYEVMETEHYTVVRSGEMAFEGIPVDGSLKLDNKITESLEPYDMSAAVPFAPAVLAGAMADHADVNSMECQEHVRKRVESSLNQMLLDTIKGYTSVKLCSESYDMQERKVTPILMPVWLITTEKEGITYTFAING